MQKIQFGLFLFGPWSLRPGFSLSAWAGKIAAASILVFLTAIFSSPTTATAQTTSSGSFRIVPLNTGTIISGSFSWSANGLLPAGNWNFTNVKINGGSNGSIKMNVLGYKDSGPNAFPQVNSGTGFTQVRSVSMCVGGSLNSIEQRGVFFGTITGSLSGNSTSGWVTSAGNCELAGHYKSPSSQQAVPASMLVSFSSSPLPSTPALLADGGTVRIKGGSYMMGDTLGDVRRDELPIHHVRLSSFAMSRTEITKEEWDSVREKAESLGYQIASGTVSAPPSDALNWKKYPVVGISWDETLKWCNAKSEIENLTPCYYVTDSAMYESITVVGSITAGSALVRIPITKETDRIGINSLVSVVSSSGAVAAQPQKAKVIRMDYERLSRTGMVTSKSNQVTGISSTEGLAPGMYVSGWGIGLSPTGSFLPVMITAVSQGSITLSSAVTLGTVQTMSLGSRTVTVSSIASTSTLTALEFFDRSRQPVWQRVAVLGTTASATQSAATLEFKPPARNLSDVYRVGKVYNMSNAKVDWSANGYRLPTEAEWEYVAKVDLVSQSFDGGTVSNGKLSSRTLPSPAPSGASPSAQNNSAYSSVWKGAGNIYNGTLSASVVAENSISNGTMFLTQAPPYRRFPSVSVNEDSPTALLSFGSYLHKEIANYQPNTPLAAISSSSKLALPNIGHTIWDRTPSFPVINPITKKRQFHPKWGGYSAPSNELPIEANGTQGMAGNVWEWCWDYFGPYKPDPEVNPRGPISGSRRVIRGGGAKYDAMYCRATERGINGPIFSPTCFEIGFRWVRNE